MRKRAFLFYFPLISVWSFQRPRFVAVPSGLHFVLSCRLQCHLPKNGNPDRSLPTSSLHCCQPHACVGYFTRFTDPFFLVRSLRPKLEN
ncbi:hypothetical protein GDO78_022319 [Eleutherodactylus coqui]|uniref:Secreted protein n=1 Tax=Eleutherodactylus coqui TaxID=57060 RepID=A0A8J6B4R6_ELECQ|nr:hypothetical protein GDO78_022319 [Eleutherodactylus coqui]